jgi:fucose 4-O-acetylase-like acetyltransferase
MAGLTIGFGGISEMRSQWVDATRGVAIILVVIGHVIQFGSHGVFDIFTNPLFVVIYAFHMPLFIFISGYLSFRSFASRPEFSVVGDRVRRLLLPIAAWAILGGTAVAVTLQLLEGNVDFPSLIKSVVSGLIPGATLWFLWVLFVAYVALACAIWLGRRIGRFAIPLSVVVVFTVPLSTEIAFYQVKWLYVFFVAGYLAYSWKAKLKRFERPATAACTALFVCLLMAWQRHDSVYVSRMDVIDDDLVTTAFSWAFRYAIGFAGVVATIGIVRAITRRRSLNNLSRIGVASMGVYCLETYLLLPLTVLPSPSYSAGVYFGLYVPVISVLIVSICYLVTSRAIKPSRPLRVALLGGR